MALKDRLDDQQIKDLISHARSIEKEMFENAPTQEAYYHMLADKILSERERSKFYMAIINQLP